MTARDLFDEARQASRELHRHDMRYNEMEARALSVCGGLSSTGTHGGAADRMGTVDAMADYEAMMERRIAGWCADLDRAYAILYGHDWNHGIAKGLGLIYAEALDYRYCQDLPMAKVAARLHCSRMTAYRAINRAFNYIAAVGIAAAEKGE